jgi:23S rRNA pseudouridine1911/1915/1917 synthase
MKIFPQIIYEDNHLLIVNKPAGILTQPSGTQQENLEDLCKTWIKETYHKPGHVFLEAVHRLDKPVSGLVVFARTSKALSRLNAFMRLHKFSKIYCAVVEGIPIHQKGVLEHYLIHDDYQSLVVTAETPQAKLCRLRYHLIKQHHHLSLLEIFLETGRYHQIRAQLACSGHPVVGDVKYKSKQAYLPSAIALHHSALQFPHPTLQKLMDVQAPLPDTMLKLLL